jgi:Domain of unknown function (DUF1990)
MPLDKSRRRDRMDQGVSAVLIAAIAAVAVGCIVAWVQRSRRRVPYGEQPRRREHASSAQVTEVRAHGDVQPASSGEGPLTWRRYHIPLPAMASSAERVLQFIQLHIRELSPSLLAEFEKTTGSDRHFAVGDEYDITILGPWNGRVRVADLQDSSFTLETLDGHPEAGRITFRVRDTADGRLAEIESLARSRDGLVNVAYNVLGVGKAVQAQVWITFLQRLSGLMGGDASIDVIVETEQVSAPEPDVAIG